ncbi:hypothetical protein GCM10007108_12390 [Thermogymnomonas acidicola]|uniref:HTH marR-type domain-containing protein n=1 Tax=Thermogymnomonas acidicola TaxID=399579 RepID=A0AA37BRT1_9ARCH|nr:hypothetical protein GCM10007108_12390 [Thermogymnomonas acidicola]
MIAVLREGSDVEPINIWRLYSRTWKKWYRCVERNLSSLGLGVNDYSTIRILSEEGECNMAYLAEMLHVSQGWMTGLIDKLEERGLVRRVRGDEDRRVIKIAITDLGRQTFEKARETHMRFVEKSLKSFSKEELREFYRLIEKLSENIDEISQ